MSQIQICRFENNLEPFNKLYAGLSLLFEVMDDSMNLASRVVPTLPSISPWYARFILTTSLGLQNNRGELARLTASGVICACMA